MFVVDLQHPPGLSVGEFRHQPNAVGIVEKEAAIAASNIAIFNPATGKGDRVGFKILEDGNKVRFFKSNGEVIAK